MSRKKYSREQHGNGFYDVELPQNPEYAKQVTGWALDVHVNPEDLDKAREVLSAYAEEENLNIGFATELALEQNKENTGRHAPTIIIDHNKSMDRDTQDIVSNMESVLMDAGVRGDIASSDEGRPVARSQYMTHRLQDVHNQYGDFPKKAPPPSPFANVVITKQITPNDDFSFEFEEESEPEL